MSEQVHIRVGETRHKKWDKHAKSEYDGNMSKLIRSAVEKEISGSEDTNTGDTQTLESGGKIDDILNGVEDNGSALESIEERLENIHDTMISQSGVPDHTLSEIYGALPVVKGDFKDADNGQIAVEFGETEKEIAEKAGVSELEAGKGIMELSYEEEFSDIKFQTIRDGDEVRYWREV
ncbi:hypothetical protein PN419_07645 [Halorubrum ezzemoulense]|uniref:hypothetical protein n=1 Tax=Halorubrum ezzemoulense TaxID=337243 RepID=UPI00232DC533|nr:hypothetical protein [Halorubrum ezzemoulense]MDB9248885.1 hypothetical protein [Halorubrum ezzemoulense]MDB9258777.1 hypothetical protein [Halorubrum ezzemoulense]MDB9262644.1 hypothetical protein [Halorubrum ezzemoulense]MDB9265796.1 hypothetical protein [Halorubrum ezzemoulense]MDB9269138.1 hypothetical protein [Halorubrum ezzemoulense]